MSTNTLLLSLLANSSANPRSTSLMLKNTLSNPYSNVMRSSSISHTDKIVKVKKEVDEQHNATLVRLSHLLRLKVKNHYYFFFCKLEQNLKKFKSQAKSNSYVNEHQQSLTKQAKEPQQQKRKEQESYSERNISALCDSVAAVVGKRQVLLEKQLISQAFTETKNYTKKVKSLYSIFNRIQKIGRNRFRFCFEAFQRLQKEKMRNQILQMNLSQVVGKEMSIALQALKRYAKQKANNHNVSCQQVKEQDAFTHQKANKSKKIVLKQKKVGFSNPIILPNTRSKVQLGLDHSLQVSKTIENDRKMGISLSLKPDMRGNCLPDLSDNCLLFGEQQIEIPYITINTAFTIDNFSTQGEMDKKSCCTDRTRRKSIELKTTPKSIREGYAISINKKEIKLENQSPLTKIDQILNRIEQLKTSKSQRSKDKKTVNINLSRELYRANPPAPIKYPKKPSHQAQKENQRLITERQINSKGKPMGGLQSSVKYKSTVLQKGKEKEGKISTARKMKMEIENIINRRNKQLYKAESAQLN